MSYPVFGEREIAVLILANLLGFVAIVLLGAGLWVLLSALLVVLLTLGCTALEGNHPSARDLSDESFDPLLTEIDKSEKVLEAIDIEIASIQSVGHAHLAPRR